MQRADAQSFDKHSGREINTWGDAVIAEFDSVVEAVRCGVAVQDAIETENLSGGGPVMRFRIGINLGDVLDDGSSVYGDGVNAASRLETACEPGSVLVSDTVYSLVHKQMAVRFEQVDAEAAKPGEPDISGYQVSVDRKNSHDEKPAPAVSEISTTALGKTSSTLGNLDGWIKKQPRISRIACGIILFLFVLNLITSGLTSPWFLFPTLPLLLVVFLARYGRRA